jgi:predicted transcriptional regulator
MGQEELQTLLEIFKGLADETRLKILGLLANQEYSVEELATLLNLKPPTVSHHLSKLKALGLVEMQAERNTHFYRLNTNALNATNKQLLSPERMASLVDDIESNDWERRVIRDLFQGERLKAIPMNSKKRAVVLKWFANRFEYGTRYQESEVNEIIKRHHPDWAYWRRELVGAGLLAREKGIYWRVPIE